MESCKNKELSDYIYVRLNEETKKLLKQKVASEGSNMTIYVRQLIMREVGQL